MASNYAQFKKNPPTGTIMAWTTATAPAGFLLCNGDPVSRSTYAALFAVISTNMVAAMVQQRLTCPIYAR